MFFLLHTGIFSHQKSLQLILESLTVLLTCLKKRQVSNWIWVFPKIGGTPPKWMVYFMVPNPIKMDDLGVFPYFWVDTHLFPVKLLMILLGQTWSISTITTNSPTSTYYVNELSLFHKVQNTAYNLGWSIPMGFVEIATKKIQ